MPKKQKSIKVRGIILEGTVVSTKPKNTAIIQREYLKFIPKYERYERRRSKINAHVPEGMEIKVGDKIEVRPSRKKSPIFTSIRESNEDLTVPEWVVVKMDSLEFEVVSLPEEKHFEAMVNTQPIVEFYSR